MSNQFIYVPFKSKGEISAISSAIAVDNDISSFVKNKIDDMSVDVRLADLSSNIMTAVEQMSTSITILTLTSYDAAYDISSYFPLSSRNTGDIAIIRKPLPDGKYEYSTYVADKTISSWVATTGSYNAKNVYFDNDIEITKTFGKYTVSSGQHRTLSSSGMSLYELLDDAFSEKLDPTRTNPTITVTAGSDTYGMVGTNYGVDKVTVTLHKGGYTYGPADTNVSAAGTDVSVYVTGGATGVKPKDTGNLVGTASSVNSQTASYSNDLSGTYTFNTSKTYNFKATVKHSDGAIPFNSIGGSCPAKKINSATVENTCSRTFTPRLPSYYAFTTVYNNCETPSELTVTSTGSLTATFGQATVNLNAVSINGNNTSMYEQTEFKPANGKYYDFYYLIPNVTGYYEAKRFNEVQRWETSSKQFTLNASKGPIKDIIITLPDGQRYNYKILTVTNSGEDSVYSLKPSYIK